MYIRPPKKKRAAPIRVLILLALVATGAYVLIWRRDLIKPIQVGPTPPPTFSATETMAEADKLYMDGKLDQAMDKYAQAAALDPADPAPYAAWRFSCLAPADGQRRGKGSPGGWIGPR